MPSLQLVEFYVGDLMMEDRNSMDNLEGFGMRIDSLVMDVQTVFRLTLPLTFPFQTIQFLQFKSLVEIITLAVIFFLLSFFIKKFIKSK